MNRPAVWTSSLPLGLSAAALLFATGCRAPTGGSATGHGAFGALDCSIPPAFIADVGPGKDGIPALTDPTMVAPFHPGAAYLRPDDRVIGLQIGNESIAIPLNIGWWHEVVNLTHGSLRLAVTHCPLTGSSMVFDRSAIDGAEFGVSGLLFMNNLMLYDRVGLTSLWPQMARGARCGPRSGTQLPMYPAVEMTWDGWVTLHPTTTVVSSETGYGRNYQLYPYGDYASPANAQVVGPVPQLDTRRSPKERILGIVSGERASIAIPFGALRNLGTVAAVHLEVGGTSTLVLWDGASESAAAFVPVVGEQTLTFRASNGVIVDDQTASRWNVDGRAIAGALAGSRLDQAQDSFVAYWFAWALFYPDTELWSAP